LERFGFSGFFSFAMLSISSGVIESRMLSGDSPRCSRRVTAMLARTITADDTTAAVPMNFW
jgi:hypothetical protein